ncbi:hypothetical protein [Salinibacter phage M8CC-19]|uniref:Uncharacterized protein n=2 Tax=Kryptosalinivirus M8CC19 TaxID=2560720 RepID=A0A2I6UGA0_9CAUD|nr:hypothetical protein FGG63_gp12 [Salinibacter phage M8CC-19]AUO79005.1 hypothetical protein [Salinibacter phage M8CC-19]AUO79238.1 hypothetical protein [Salinibacter phage M31CC-1]
MSNLNHSPVPELEQIEEAIEEMPDEKVEKIREALGEFSGRNLYTFIEMDQRLGFGEDGDIAFAFSTFLYFLNGLDELEETLEEIHVDYS